MADLIARLDPPDPALAAALEDLGVPTASVESELDPAPRRGTECAVLQVADAQGWERVRAARARGWAPVVIGPPAAVARALSEGAEAAVGPADPAVVAACCRAALRRRLLPYYEQLHQLSTDAVEISDPEVHLIQINPAFEEMTGYDREQALGKTPIELFRTGNQNKAHFAAVNEAVNKGEVWAGEVVDRRSDGSLGIVYTTVSAVTAGGQRVGYLVTKAEAGRTSVAAAHAGAADRTRALLEEAGDAVFVSTLDGQLADVNRAACVALGLQRSELLLTNLFDVLDDAPAGDWAALFHSLEPGGSTTLEAALRGGVPVELVLTRTDVAMEPVVLITARDITERKRAEEALRAANAELTRLNADLEAEVRARATEVYDAAQRLTAVLDNAADGLLGVTRDGRITVANAAATRILGLPPPGAKRLLDGVDAPKLVAAVQACLDSGHQDTAEFPFGAGHTATAVASPIRTEHGEVRACVVVVRDVTLEREVDRMKTDFIATVSHELRTPLTSVLGFARVARNKLEGRVRPALSPEDKAMKAVDQVSRNLGIVFSEASRLTALIGDVLDISKMESGRVDWAKEPVDLGEVVRAAVDSTATLFDETPVALELELADCPPVLGDRDRLVQVLVNLISNAHKFTERGSVAVSLEPEAEAVRLAVADTGIGIAAADQQAIFERFHQLGDTLTDKPLGTGLGLSICQQIVLAHGGSIDVTSEPGQGSTFSVRLPRS